MDYTEVFNEALAEPSSPMMTAIWREALGAEYPEGADPYSWVSRSELDIFAEIVRATGPRLVDVGCGRGGPGLWVAHAAGVPLIGVDIAQAGLDAAAASAVALGVPADYRLGAFDSLPISDGEADVVMSVDAFLFTPDKPAAVLELTRVLSPGGRVAMTTWDFHTQPDSRPPQVDDHRPLFESAGFVVERYDETEEWKRRQSRSIELMLAQVELLAQEAGEPVEEFRAGIEDMAASIACMMRRVLLVARRGD